MLVRGVITKNFDRRIVAEDICLNFFNSKTFSFFQMGYLDVVTPPDFVEDETSGDVMLPEGGTAKLTCRARGYPVPSVVWRREDGQDMILKEPNGIKNKGMSLNLYQSFISKSRNPI